MITTNCKAVLQNSAEIINNNCMLVQHFSTFGI